MLDAAQAAALVRFREQWAAMRTATAPADRPLTEDAVAMCYRAAGLPPPGRIEWCASPIGMARQWEKARHQRSAGPNVKTAVVDALRDRAMAGTWWRIDPDIRKAIFAGLRSPQADVAAAAMAELTLRAARTGPPPWSARLRQAAASLLRRARRTDFEHASTAPALLDWLAPYQYLQEFCGVKTDDCALSGLWRVAANAGWMLPHAHVCWLSERPAVLAFDISGRLHSASGPALAYRDGWSAYLWKGVELPAALIEQPGAITLDAIDRQPNIVLRRCMIEIMGPKCFLALGGASISARDDTGTLWRKIWRFGDEWAAVEVENGTPEPDGTRQRYILQVPPDLRTARAAVAWTYGMSEREYRGLTLRT